MNPRQGKIRAIFLFFFLVSLINTNTDTSFAQEGSLDYSFGNNGFVTSTLQYNDSIYTLGPIALDSQSRVVALAGDNFRENLLVRYTSAGVIDPKFGKQGRVLLPNEIGSRLVIDHQDRIIIGSSPSELSHEVLLTRYTSLGTLDTSFGVQGVVKILTGDFEYISPLAIDGLNRVVVGGFVNSASGNLGLVRITSKGALDTTFGKEGFVRTSVAPENPLINGGGSVTAIAIDSSNRIVAAGESQLYDPHFLVARYDASGNLDTTFGTAGITSTPIGLIAEVKSITLDASARIVLVGSAGNAGNPISEQSTPTIARYSSSGILDSTFGDSGILQPSVSATGELSSVATDKLGRIVAGGYLVDSKGLAQLMLTRISPSGSLDPSFGVQGIDLPKPPGCTVPGKFQGTINDILIDNSNRIVAVSGNTVTANHGELDSECNVMLSRYFNYETPAASPTPTRSPTPTLIKSPSHPSKVSTAKVTIVCTKGRTTKKVTGAPPKCPIGYKIRK